MSKLSKAHSLISPATHKTNPSRQATRWSTSFYQKSRLIQTSWENIAQCNEKVGIWKPKTEVTALRFTNYLPLYNSFGLSGLGFPPWYLPTFLTSLTALPFALQNFTFLQQNNFVPISDSLPLLLFLLEILSSKPAHGWLLFVTQASA